MVLAALAGVDDRDAIAAARGPLLADEQEDGAEAALGGAVPPDREHVQLAGLERLDASDDLLEDLHEGRVPGGCLPRRRAGLVEELLEGPDETAALRGRKHQRLPEGSKALVGGADSLKRPGLLGRHRAGSRPKGPLDRCREDLHCFHEPLKLLEPSHRLLQESVARVRVCEHPEEGRLPPERPHPQHKRAGRLRQEAVALEEPRRLLGAGAAALDSADSTVRGFGLGLARPRLLPAGSSRRRLAAVSPVAGAARRGRRALRGLHRRDGALSASHRGRRLLLLPLLLAALPAGAGDDRRLAHRRLRPGEDAPDDAVDRRGPPVPPEDAAAAAGAGARPAALLVEPVGDPLVRVDVRVLGPVPLKLPTPRLARLVELMDGHRQHAGVAAAEVEDDGVAAVPDLNRVAPEERVVDEGLALAPIQGHRDTLEGHDKVLPVQLDVGLVDGRVVEP
mmetsp:Transcript_28360/g.67464  ORF Transcript_28360/g.67464 Transcript_28360/m.67464 type:complete len:451 (-) Transcript_28360:887-2239(-)